MTANANLESNLRRYDEAKEPYWQHLNGCLECSRDPLAHLCEVGRSLFEGNADQLADEIAANDPEGWDKAGRILERAKTEGLLKGTPLDAEQTPQLNRLSVKDNRVASTPWEMTHDDMVSFGRAMYEVEWRYSGQAGEIVLDYFEAPHKWDKEYQQWRSLGGTLDKTRLEAFEYWFDHKDDPEDDEEE